MRGSERGRRTRVAVTDPGMLWSLKRCSWIGRPSPNSPAGEYRWMMKETWRLRTYDGQRWQAEATISMTRRRLGDRIEQVDYHAQR